MNIEKLSEISKMSVFDEEKDLVFKKVNNIIKVMDKIKDIPQNEISDYSAHNNLREDEILPSNDKQSLLSCITVEENGCFVIPRVVK